MRRNVTVKSRRAFVLSSATTTRKKAEETLLDALKSPFGVAEVPVRVTTFTQKDPASDKARIVVAAEVGQPGGEPEEFTVGYVLLDSDGKVVSGSADKRVLSVPERRGRMPRATTSARSSSSPATTRCASASSTRRVGAAASFARSTPGSSAAKSSRWAICWSATRATRRRRRASGPASSRESTAISGRSSSCTPTRKRPLDTTKVSSRLPTTRTRRRCSPVRAQMVVGHGADAAEGPGCPVGDAAAAGPLRRARTHHARRQGRRRAGASVHPRARRPHRLPSPFMQGASRSSIRSSRCRRECSATMLDSVEKRFPALKGRWPRRAQDDTASAAVEALTSGDQAAAAFFKGLDWYSKGQLNQAVTQLELAAGPRREFFPAAFYLGAAFAAAGRDRDAAGVWQMAIGKEPRPLFAYTLLADARLRDGQPASVIDVLKPAYERTPADDEIGHRLMAAYLMTGRYEEALPVLDGYLSRNPTDQTALLAAVFAQYQVATRERLVLPAADQTKLARYVRAYEGPYKALLAKYVEIMRRG